MNYLSDGIEVLYLTKRGASATVTATLGVEALSLSPSPTCDADDPIVWTGSVTVGGVEQTDVVVVIRATDVVLAGSFSSAYEVLLTADSGSWTIDYDGVISGAYQWTATAATLAVGTVTFTLEDDSPAIIKAAASGTVVVSIGAVSDQVAESTPATDSLYSEIVGTSYTLAVSAVTSDPTTEVEEGATITSYTMRVTVGGGTQTNVECRLSLSGVNVEMGAMAETPPYSTEEDMIDAPGWSVLWDDGVWILTRASAAVGDYDVTVRNHTTGNTPTRTMEAGDYPGNASCTINATSSDQVGASTPTSATRSLTITEAAPAWTIDATSSKGAPADATEWTALRTTESLSAWSNPNYLWLCQEASGNLADSIASMTLTAGGSGLGYEAAVSGWSRKALTTTDGTGGRWQSTSFDDISSDSVLVLLYARVDTIGANNRSLLEVGTSTDCRIRSLTTPARRASAGGNFADGGDHTGVVRAYVLRIDRAGTTVAVFTSGLSKLSPTWNTSITGGRIVLGGNSNTPSQNSYLYAAAWVGAAAERSDDDVTDLLTALGW